ncbi:MAG: hypothetical protein Udaeo2_21530 [Candidatus Udaeobacter sp.]|nr:MAG: hypothetical protein Udaeo2_21530 [Candidatus Udaeobacter sp.]
MCSAFFWRLTTGALSDYVGRRPTVLGALMLNIIAMVLFITAGSGGALIAARGAGLAPVSRPQLSARRSRCRPEARAGPQ